VQIYKSDDLVKAQFYDKDVGYENLWAAPLGDNLYRLESIPFFIYGISLHDVVLGLPNEEGILVFSELIKPSGNKTLRARPKQFTVPKN